MKNLTISERPVGLIDGTTVRCNLCLDGDDNIFAQTSKKDGGIRLNIQQITPSAASTFREIFGGLTNYDVKAVERRDYPDDIKSLVDNLWLTAEQLGLSVVSDEEQDDEDPLQ